MIFLNFRIEIKESISILPGPDSIIRCPVFSVSIHKLRGRSQLLICPWQGAEYKRALLVCFVLFAKLWVYMREQSLSLNIPSVHSSRDRFDLQPTYFSFVKKAKHSQKRFSEHTQCFLIQTVILKMPHRKAHYTSRLWDFLVNCCHSTVIHCSRKCLRNKVSAA